MSNFRRHYVKGGTYFLTVNLNDRRQDYLVRYIDAFRAAFRETHQYLPSETFAICILPDHFHWVLTLPENDHNFSRRIHSLKTNFTCRLPTSLRTPNTGQNNKQESGIWQSKFWEHCIRDERDLYNHIAYTYYNPVKHGCAKSVAAWPYSSFHRDVSEGLFPADWGGTLSEGIKNLYAET